jgi:uncharacterized membrane protein YccC
MASEAIAAQTGEAKSLRRRLVAWLDGFVASDPGLNRFRAALLMLLTVGLALAGESVFLDLTHALQIGAHAAPPSTVAQVNHEALVVALLLGAIFGMLSCFGVMDRTAKGQLATMLFLPFPMIGSLAIGLAIGDNRTVSLVWLVVVLTVGTYLRRFGPRGFIAGMVLFIGDFFGFFLHGALRMSDLGWLAAEIGVGLVVAIVVRFALFYPRPAKALARTQRSFAALTRNVAELALALFDDPTHSERRARALRRQVARLTEAALMIDAQLGDPGALPDGTSGQFLHQRLFDLELALTNVARFAEALARADLPPGQREQIRGALIALIARDREAAKAHATALMAALRDGNEDATGEIPASVVTAHRFASSVIDLADASNEWSSVAAPAGEEGARFQPSVMLFGGWLPGSTQVSAAASLEPGHGLGDRATLHPYTRTAIQMGVAVGAAILLGDLLSEKHFYWAVIAAFMTFMGTNNQGEQTRKAISRVTGTLVGIAAGSLLVKLIGHHPHVAIAVILLSLSLGVYLMRINNAFLVIGITVTVSQLYVQLGEFTNSLLVQRLEETAIGAAVTIAVVTLVLPLRTRRVLRVAMRSNIEATARLVAHATARLLGDQGDGEKTLRAEARDIDASYQALMTTAAPIRRSLFGTIDQDLGSSLRQSAGSRYYARNLAADVEPDVALDGETRADIQRGSATLRSSLEIVAGSFTGPRDGTYTRSSSLFDQAEQRLQRSAAPHKQADLAIRDLRAIDETMAEMAEALHLSVTDYDTDVDLLGGLDSTR